MTGKTNVVAGLGEVGKPLFQLLSKKNNVVGYDTNPNLMRKVDLEKIKKIQTNFLHICIPYNDNFLHNVISLYKKFNPEFIVIHSTIKPGTTSLIQKKIPIPVIYSATRGIHKRMLKDMKKYVKFYALENSPNHKKAIKNYELLLKKSGVKTKRMSKPITLELAKIICDTSYYGWLITYSQISNVIAMKNNVDYDEMWEFADEIHKYLGNRPKMFPGFIGGHCVIPNLGLIDNEILNLINEFNNKYDKILQNNIGKNN